MKLQLSTTYSKGVEENRNILLRIIDVIVKLACRGLPLRGSWNKENCSGDSNFMHFVNWLAQYDITLERHIKMAPKNATYIFLSKSKTKLFHVLVKIFVKIFCRMFRNHLSQHFGQRNYICKHNLTANYLCSVF